MKRIIFFVAMLISVLPNYSFAVQRTVSWQQVTTYVDNTLIEPGLIVKYDITMDNVFLVVGATTTSYAFEHANADQNHTFFGRAWIFPGYESEWSEPYLWHCPPLGSLPSVPVQPIIINIRRP